MKPSLIKKLDNLSNRLEEVTQLLASENIAEHLDRYRQLSKEYSELTPIVNSYQTLKNTQNNLSAAKEMYLEPDMKELAQEEINSSAQLIKTLEHQLQLLLLPKDHDDHKNIILEIRAGTGGDEASLFVGDLFRMYTKYAEHNAWKVEIISAHSSEVGGYKEIISQIQGHDIYRRLKFESGGHRVQRVPTTENQGRIHTSSCTVAVMPESDKIEEINLNPNHLKIDTFRASGAGGQHVNKTDSAVRITHIPTGLVVECQDGRSQHSNKAQAMKVLATRLYDQQKNEAHAKEAATRKSLIGSGDRSERIRTYNYPQGRVTDHRINLTLYKLEDILQGDLQELVQALTIEHQTEQLKHFYQSL